MTTRDRPAGRVALMTGAARGLGRAVATTLAGAVVPRDEPDFPR